MTNAPSLAIILAAGEGTRMKSSMPKVMHPVGGRPMLDAVLATARAAGLARLAVVVGPNAEGVRNNVARVAVGAEIFEQAKRLGTANAVLAARPALLAHDGPVIVLYGDTPLVRPETLTRLGERLAAGADIAVLGFTSADPTGYGRLIVENGRLVAIVEEKDADAATKAVTLCNSGIMGFRAGLLPELLDAIKDNNANREFYLTDAIAIGTQRGLAAAVVAGEEEEFAGINDRRQLAAAEAIFQARARAAAMADGVTLIAPDTVFFSHDTRLGRDVTIGPNVVFGPGTSIGDGATIHAFSHIEGARVAGGAIVGPFARLRPGATIGADAHIGNFVEVKNAEVGAGAKINHLSYVGDASVGAKTNIGAGTITCNYDGYFKHRTEIGAGVFVGSHTTLVAPVRVGDGGFTAAGSVITRDVPADAMAFGRARQEIKEGMARAKREALAALKLDGQ